MATGILAAMGASATLTYTPLCDAKVMLNVSAGSMNINGQLALAYSANTAVQQIIHYVGAGQTLTVTTAASSSGIVSCLEAI